MRTEKEIGRERKTKKIDKQSYNNAIRNGGSGAYNRRSDGTTSSLSIPPGDLSSNYRVEVQALKAATERLTDKDCNQQNIVLLPALRSPTNGPTDLRTQRSQDHSETEAEISLETEKQWI